MSTRLKYLALIGAGFFSSAFAQPETAAYTLPQAIDFALKNNPDLRMTQERIAQAEAQLGEAAAAFYPQVKAGLNYQHSDNPAQAFAMVIAQRRLNFAGTDFNHPGGVDNYRPEITASYSLFRGGQDYYAHKAAELGVEAADLENSATRNQLVNWVTAGFYSELAAEQAHQVALRAIEAVNSELQQSRLRFDAGTLLKSDVLSLEVQLAEAKESEIQSAHAIELAKTSLKTLLGLSAADGLQLNAANSWQTPVAPAPFAELLKQALVQHPDMQAADKRVAIASAQLDAAKGAHLPKADAFVSYGSDSKNLDYSGNRDNVTAGVAVSVELFSGFATSERVKKAEHQLNIANESARKIRLELEAAVKAAHLKLQDALARVAVADAALASAEEALRLVNAQREAGTVTVTRYIEAEVARDKAQARHITARLDGLRAQAELNLALGLTQ